MNNILLFITIASFITSLACIREVAKVQHEVIYGAVKVRGEVYKCERWNYLKENRK